MLDAMKLGMQGKGQSMPVESSRPWIKITKGGEVWGL